MGWEKRRNEFYYYRKKRVNGRVCSEYVGRGDVAQISVEIIQDKQLKRKTEREARHCARQTEAEIDRQLANVDAAIYAITDAKLSAEGYHKHKGQWRKRHAAKAISSTI